MKRYALLLAAGAMLARAQQPPISNADLKQVSAANGLESAIRTAVGSGAGPAWIGYAVPAIPGDGNSSCCWNDGGRGCGLEGRRVGDAPAAPVTPVRLEGPSHVVVLMRYEQGASDRLRVLSPDCPLDAGGLPFHWFSGVKPAESVAMLTAWVGRRQETALHAIAMHAGPEAESALVKYATTSENEGARKAALLWLARSRGKQGYDVVSKVAREDPSEKVREHAMFAMSQSRQPEAIPALIRFAREDKAPHVRKQAMMWLGQSRDPRAIQFFEQVLAK